MHIKKDLYSTHLEQTCSYSPLLRTSLRHILYNPLSFQETQKLLSQNYVCVINPLVSKKKYFSRIVIDNKITSLLRLTDTFMFLNSMPNV